MPSRAVSRPNALIKPRVREKKERRAAPDIRKPNAVLKRMGSKDGNILRRAEFSINHPAITVIPSTEARTPDEITMNRDLLSTGIN